MKVIFKNSTLTFAKGLWPSATGRIIKVLSSEVEAVTLPIGKSCIVTGRNLVDLAHLKYHKIINDSGVEVDDTSSYFDNFIPMFGGGTIKSNVGISRVYFYDQNKSLLVRDGHLNETSIKVPSAYNGTPIYWIKIQTKATVSQTPLETMIVTKDEDAVPDIFESFSSNTDGTIYSPYSWVYADDLSEMTIKKK